MILKVENSNAVELVSTWRYLHPVFTEGASKQRDQMHSRRVSVDLKVPTGAYVDMYALGIIALELLTNQTAYVRPATERSIDDVISTHNKAFLAQSISLRCRISNLVLQLLSVNPSRETISARTIASIAESILLEIPADGQLADAPLIVDGRTAQPVTISHTKTATAVVALKGLRASLEQETLVLLSEGDAQALLTDFRRLGENKIRLADRDAMTVICFSLIIVMIMIAVVMSAVTGSFAWGGIFGGLGVSAVIGTLIWRPYDRLFRATILAQQIEVIHIRIVAGLRSVHRGEQLKVCEEAIEALGIVFREHALVTEASNRRSGLAHAKGLARRHDTLQICLSL